MRYYHSIFKELHFDYGKMIWSVNHIPFFGALMSVCDHRNMGSLHSIGFYAFLRVLTGGTIQRKQADTIFFLIDMSSTGEVEFSEMAFWSGIVVAQKDHLEREFLYMHAWKIWVTFNERGAEKITTREFRRTGLFFDFDYPTIYHMYRDYNWDDDKSIEFARFRFYLISCIHVRSLRRATAKYLRYRKFKLELLEALSNPLTKVLRENTYPAPRTILRAIRSVKIPPIEGQETIYHWSDVFTLSWIRAATFQQWRVIKLKLLKLLDESPSFRWLARICCCGLCCFGVDEDFERAERFSAKCGKICWEKCCVTCHLHSWFTSFRAKIPFWRSKVKPMKPVVIRKAKYVQRELDKARRAYKNKDVKYEDAKESWRKFGQEEDQNACFIQ